MSRCDFVLYRGMRTSFFEAVMLATQSAMATKKSFTVGAYFPPVSSETPQEIRSTTNFT